MSLESRERMERQRSARRDNVKLASALGAHAFGPHDGFIEPTAWEGMSIPPREWVVRNLIPTAEVTMITGNGGEGKSLLTMQLLIAGATGTRWLGVGTKAVRSMGVYCEDDKDELHRRASYILGGERMSFSALDEMHLICRKGKDTVLYEAQRYDTIGAFTPTFQRLRTTAIEMGVQLLVLDSLYDFFGGDENNKTQVKHFISGLAELAQDLHGAVMIVAHPSLSGMSSGSGTGGSTAWHNAVRSRLYLHRRPVEKWELERNPNAKGPLVLQPMKGNYAPPQDALELVWEEGRFVPVINPSSPPRQYQDND